MSLRYAFEEVKMLQSMRRKTSNRKIALQKCLENSKRRKMTLRLLKEGKTFFARHCPSEKTYPSLHYVQSVNSSAKTIKLGWKGCSNPPRSREAHVLYCRVKERQ